MLLTLPGRRNITETNCRARPRYGFPERVDTWLPIGLASSYAAIARPSYKERFFEIIELVMINDNFLVESLDERTLSNRGGQPRTTARDISRDNNN